MDTSAYEHALTVWSKADFTTLQKELDKNILDVKTRETSSLDSRKNLATETKKFKKLASDDKLDQINKIIKHYQKEIDNLTERSKNAEKSLLNVYTKISEAPDPTPLLQNSVVELSKLDGSDKVNQETNDATKNAALHEDYESLKKKLIDLEQNSAVTLAKTLAVKEEEINSVWKEKQKHWSEQKEDLQKQVTLLQENNKSLEKKISKQIDFDNNDKSSESNPVPKPHRHIDSSELTLLNQELETAQTRVLQLEQRNEELSGSLAKANSEAANESTLHSKIVKIGHLESENALLSASLEKERQANIQDINNLKEKVRKLENETKTYKSELDNTSRKLKHYSDYDEIKNELAVLKRIEFGSTSDIEEIDGDGDNESVSFKANNVGSSLIAANKKLQASLSDLRVIYGNSKEHDIQLEKKVKELTKQLEDMKAQNIKLEADLEKIDIVEPKFNDIGSIISGSSKYANNRFEHNGRWSPTSSIIGIPTEGESDMASLGSGNGSGSNTILPIITKQRDRFRLKNTELEKQLRQYSTEKNKLKSEITKLKTDNGKLYERVRYLSSYGVTHSNNNTNTSTNINDSTSSSNFDTEAQYSNKYEESLHPLATFRKKEMDYYKKKRLSLLEKLFVSFANIVLQNKTTRMIFLFYCIGLHGLVFMMSMYVINISGYLTPEVGIVQSSSLSSASSVNVGAVGVHTKKVNENLGKLTI
ncbi:protein CASP [Monosporozyma servazzii]